MGLPWLADSEFPACALHICLKLKQGFECITSLPNLLLGVTSCTSVTHTVADCGTHIHTLTVCVQTAAYSAQKICTQCAHLSNVNASETSIGDLLCRVQQSPPSGTVTSVMTPLLEKTDHVLASWGFSRGNTMQPSKSAEGMSQGEASASGAELDAEPSGSVTSVVTPILEKTDDYLASWGLTNSASNSEGVAGRSETTVQVRHLFRCHSGSFCIQNHSRTMWSAALLKSGWGLTPALHWCRLVDMSAWQSYCLRLQ